jgi:hypothetical protein
MSGMSWEHDLFAVLDDLEAQAAGAWAAEREAELADRARTEYASVTLASRLMAARGEHVVLELAHAGRVEGRLVRVGEGWCLVGGPRGEWLVATGHLVGAHVPGTRSVPEVAWSPVDRLGLGAALRRLSDAGAHCLLHRADGSRRGGTLGRVGADFVEVLDAGRVDLVPSAALVAVCRLEG